MASKEDPILVHLPQLRRFAALLTGSRELGDTCVEAALRRLPEGPTPADEADTHRQLFAALNAAWAEQGEPHSTPNPEGPDEAPQTGGGLRHALALLPARQRQMVLLVKVEHFSTEETASLAGLPLEEAERLLQQALERLLKPDHARVLVIEDEALQAMNLTDIVREIGCQVVGVAATAEDAVRLGQERKADLVLADVHLGEGPSGIEAADRIQQLTDAPVIFVTAHPQLVKRADVPPGCFVVEKPYAAEAIHDAVQRALGGGALSFH